MQDGCIQGGASGVHLEGVHPEGASRGGASIQRVHRGGGSGGWLVCQLWSERSWLQEIPYFIVSRVPLPCSILLSMQLFSNKLFKKWHKIGIHITNLL